MLPSQKPHFQNPVAVSGQDPSAAIANSICWIQVLENHDRTSNLEFQLCQWKRSTVDLIQVLHRVIEQRVIFSCLLRSWNIVNAVENLRGARELCKNGFIEQIDIIVEAGKNDTLREVLVRMIKNVDVRVKGVNEGILSVFCTAKVIREGDVTAIISVFAMANFQLPFCKVGLCFNMDVETHILMKV